VLHGTALTGTCSAGDQSRHQARMRNDPGSSRPLGRRSVESEAAIVTSS
jgi:hypothetical protein